MGMKEARGLCWWEGDRILTKIIALLSGSRPEGYPEWKMKKVMLGEQWPRGPNFSLCVFFITFPSKVVRISKKYRVPEGSRKGK